MSYMLSGKATISKHISYYVDGKLCKTLEGVKDALDSKLQVEKLDKRSGDRRYYDYDKNKWLKVVARNPYIN